jgi:hypothetical protein
MTGQPIMEGAEMAQPTLHTLVWIDAREAVIVARDGDEVVLDRLVSDVPAHRKATGQVRHEPGIRHGGGGAPQTAGEPHRLEHLHRFIHEVAARLPEADDLTIIGPGTVREQLEREIRAADRHHRRTRVVTCAAAGRMSDRQLVARLSREAGVEPRRRTVGAYRWSVQPGVARPTRTRATSRRVAAKPPRDQLEEIET